MHLPLPPPVALALPLAVTALAAGLAAQEVRLVDRIEAPLVYLASEGGASEGGASASGSGDRAERPATRSDSVPSAASLLEDPALLGLLGLGEAGTAGASTLEHLRQLLRSSTGEIELAMADLQRRSGEPDLPLLVCRARLGETGRAALATALAGDSLARPAREVAGHVIYALGVAGGRSPGSQLEVALVGRDLLVANHATSMDEVLCWSPLPERDRGQRARAAGARPTLAEDARFRALRRELAAARGSLLLYLAWDRLWRLLGRDLPWAERMLVQSVGLSSTRHILIGVQPAEQGFVTTALIDQSDGLDGLLAAVEPVPFRQLLRDDPASGIASLTLAIEPRRLTRDAQLGPARLFHAGLVGGCRRMGLDFYGQIVPRLGRSACCRLLLLDDEDGPPRVAFSVKARSRSSALALFGDLRRTLSRLQVPVEDLGKGDNAGLALQLANGADASLGVVGDSVVLGFGRGLVQQIGRIDRAEARAAQKSRKDLQVLLQRLGASRRKVVGLFQLDFRGLAQRARPDAGRAADTVADPPPLLVGRHAGLLSLEPDHLRIEVITPLE